MADKNEIMTALRELKEKRLLSSEAEALMKPYAGASFDLRLDFVSSSRSFGRQKIHHTTTAKRFYVLQKNGGSSAMFYLVQRTTSS